MSRVYVVAGNRAEFARYCHAKDLRPGVDAKFINRPEQIAGVSGERFILIGTYRRLPDWPAIRGAIWLCPNSSMEIDREEGG